MELWEDVPDERSPLVSKRIELFVRKENTMSEIGSATPDILAQHSALHDTIWMLKDTLIGLDKRLGPVLDTRPQPDTSAGAFLDKDYHCEFAALLIEDHAELKSCLELARSILRRLQI